MISALLQRDNRPQNGIIEWIDITSQGSKSLPDDFHIAPGLHHIDSPTLYESDTNVTFTTPFTCTTDLGENLVHLLFYSPNFTDSITCIEYLSNSSGDSGFGRGMY